MGKSVKETVTILALKINRKKAKAFYKWHAFIIPSIDSFG